MVNVTFDLMTCYKNVSFRFIRELIFDRIKSLPLVKHEFFRTVGRIRVFVGSMLCCDNFSRWKLELAAVEMELDAL